MISDTYTNNVSHTSDFRMIYDRDLGKCMYLHRYSLISSSIVRIEVPPSLFTPVKAAS